MAVLSFLKKNFHVLLLALAVLAGALLSYFRAFESFELQTYDLRCKVRGPRPVSPQVVLVEISTDALEYLGRWPFDREYHAHLIDILKRAGAKAVAFDILFFESQVSDAAVVRASRDAGNVYFATTFTHFSARAGRFESPETKSPLLAEYAAAAKGVGHVNADVDQDGKRRRAIPVFWAGQEPVYQMAFKIFSDLSGYQPDLRDYHPGGSMHFGTELTVPLGDDGCVLVSYAGTWAKTFKHVSYLDIIGAYLDEMEGRKPRIDLAELSGKVCLVGLTAQGTQDMSPIPLESVYPMVGYHANILNALLTKDFIYRLPRWVNTLLLLLLAFSINWMAYHQKPIRALLMTLGIMGLFAGVAFGVFCFFGVWIDLFLPLAAFLSVYAVSTLTRTLAEVKKRELIENELKIASQIQRSFLPESLPEIPGFEVAVYMKPAKAVGGDLYTFMKLGEKKIGVMAGDVSGKGTPAALFMAKAVSEFKFSARDKIDPAEALMLLNNSISAESTGGLFVTMSYAIFDLETMTMEVSNGGHLPMVVAGSDGVCELLSAEEGMPIGVMGDIPFSSFKRPLKPGDCFAFYSDGVSEARNKKKDEYSIERLQEMIRKFSSGSAKEILDGTIADLNAFMGTADQHDDITLMVIKVIKTA